MRPPLSGGATRCMAEDRAGVRRQPPGYGAARGVSPPTGTGGPTGLAGMRAGLVGRVRERARVGSHAKSTRCRTSGRRGTGHCGPSACHHECDRVAVSRDDVSDVVDRALLRCGPDDPAEHGVANRTGRIRLHVAMHIDCRLDCICICAGRTTPVRRAFLRSLILTNISLWP